MVVKVNITETKLFPVNRNLVIKRIYLDSTNSPRNTKGKLLLKPNPLTFYRYIETGRWSRGTSSRVSYGWDQFPIPSNVSVDLAKAQSIAYGKMVGRLHKGDASLGVTLASATQSRSMIINRLTQIGRLFKTVRSPKSIRRLKTVHGAYQLKGLTLNQVAKRTANDHLEVVFGWIPLYQDVYSAMEVLVSDFPDEFLRAVGRTQTILSSRFAVGNEWTWQTNNRCVWSTKCTVSNPNTWLLNRLGLINPAVVIWDLIPWSFVVNMFINVTSVLKSFTDLAGLTLKDSSVTTTYTGVASQTYLPDIYVPGSSGTIWTVKRVVRTLGIPPRPSLEVRLPQLNLGLAAIAGSLVVQQADRIRKLVN